MRFSSWFVLLSSYLQTLMTDLQSKHQVLLGDWNTEGEREDGLTAKKVNLEREGKGWKEGEEELSLSPGSVCFN